jgi:mRNA-degrading endonuclease toxin of MazEF toxin-antitoxin module
MKRGTICWVNLEPVSPPELGKTRRAVVISNSDQNMVLQSVVVVPLSSQAPEIWPLRLCLELSRGKTSFAVLPGIRQVSKARIQEIIGIARAGDMSRLNEAISLYLSD